MISHTKEQISTKKFVLEGENIKPILDFLKKVGISFTKELRTRARGKGSRFGKGRGSPKK
jgi:hypothetical protein